MIKKINNYLALDRNGIILFYGYFATCTLIAVWALAH